MSIVAGNAIILFLIPFLIKKRTLPIASKVNKNLSHRFNNKVYKEMKTAFPLPDTLWHTACIKYPLCARIKTDPTYRLNCFILSI